MGRQLTGFLGANWLLLVIVGAIVTSFLVLRTTETDVGSVERVDALLADGQPSLVEFYSNT